MRFRNLLRALLFPLALIFGIVGTILMLYGGIELFKLDPQAIQQGGFTKEMSLYADCTKASDMLTNQTASGGQLPTPQQEAAPANQTQEKSSQSPTSRFRGTVQSYCDAQQRPYMYLFCLAAVMTFLANLLAFLLLWKSPRWLLFWFGIHTAITISLLFMAIYAMMHATRSLYRVQDCAGYDQSVSQALERIGVRCYESSGRYADAPNYLYQTVLPCFWVGTAFNLVSMGLLSWLFSGLWYRKGVDPTAATGPSWFGRERYTTDPRYEHRPSSAHTTTSTTGGPQSYEYRQERPASAATGPTYYTESERRARAEGPPTV